MKRFFVLLCAIGFVLYADGKNKLLPDSTLIPGKSYFGTAGYIEYVHGNLPLVISAPHGGYDKPDNMKDRTRSALNQDIRTQELTRELSDVIFELTGKRPYLIINKLHRIKLDPNRELEVAIQGDSLAKTGFDEFHEFIELAEKDVYEKWGTGFYIDVHAHPSRSRKVEIDYLLEAELLFFPDEDLNDELFIQKSSLKNLIRNSDYSLAELIRGKVSFGAMLAKKGWEVLPSPQKPEPDSEKYFSGGYNTATHGAPEKYNFNGLQVETHWEGLRDTDENMRKFCIDFIDVLVDYLKLHYEMDLANLP